MQVTAESFLDEPLISAASAPIPVWISAAEGRRRYFNPAWREFTGHDHREADYDGTADVHSEDRETTVREYSEALRNQCSFTLFYRLKHVSGSYRWVKEIAIPKTTRGQFDGFIGYCIDVEDQRQAERARREMAERLIGAQEAERTRIARELHDDISQSLVVLGIQMLRAGQPVSGEPGRTHPGAPELYQKLKKVAQQVTSLSHELHSSSLEYLGLTKAIQGYCQEFSVQYRIAVDCRCPAVPINLNGITSLCILRVVQEALHNVAKHSQAKNVHLELAAISENELQLNVQDDGIGFNFEEARLAGGIGLISMRERMNLVGATCTINSAPGQGTSITCIVPLHDRLQEKGR
jgi:PAS domain S-box-containing protein